MLDDKQKNKELAKKMLNPYYFTDRELKVGFRINLNSHHIIHAISKLTVLLIIRDLVLKLYVLIKS